MDKTQIFIKQSKEKHGNKYDYSKVNYKNNKTPVCIICHNKDKFGREHGEFWQTPKDHLKGNKCPRCLYKVLNTEDFILYANDKHNNKYDYSKTVYIKSNIPCTIICPIHGEFQMRPSNHLNGQGCPLCGNKEKGQYRKNNINDFINQATLIHHDKYDYSKVKYINNKTKVTITCPKHGDFEQRPNDHLNGNGCPECGRKYNVTERNIFSKLKNRYINVIYQYSAPFLHGKTSSQTIDFFLPDYNIGIEYHGRQHFMPISKFGGIDGFNKTKERDLKKYLKCKENGLIIYYITFEKCDTSDYFADVLRNINDLFSLIENNRLKNK